MKEYQKNKQASRVEEKEPFMKTFLSQEEAELYNLKRDLNRSDMEKFRLFTLMLRRNAMFKRAKIYKNNSSD
jgi:hypothetical protein